MPPPLPPLHPLLHHPPTLALSVSDLSSVSNPPSLKKDDRFPPWSYPETSDFIAIRAELEKDSAHSRRGKALWETIAGKMRERGHRRSAEQCKCKWKNLLNRYKGKETSEPDNGRQCPFFEELHAIFMERAKSTDGLLLESGSRARLKKKGRKGLLGDTSSEDFSDEENAEDEDSEEERTVKSKKRKTDRERQRANAEKGRANTMQEVLENFFQQQQRIEVQWMEAMERREEERRLREQEFRSSMENMENERIMREQQWREREEQRRAREEARAEKRDALLCAILNRLAGEGL